MSDIEEVDKSQIRESLVGLSGFHSDWDGDICEAFKQEE